MLQSLMLVCAGCAGLVVNTMVLRYMLKYLGETRVLYIGKKSLRLLALALLYAGA